MNKNYKGIRGITLIALVITIIVLLILAGVSIVALTGENGIITRAVKSRQTSAEADAKEEVARVISALLIDNTGDYSKITPNNIVTELNKDNDRKITSSSTTFPTNIIYPATNTINKIEITINKDMSIGNIQSSGGNNGGNTGGSSHYDNEVVTATQKELQQLFTWNIENGKAIITGMNEEYINETFAPKDNIEGSEEDSDYIYKNDKRLTTLVVPYEVEEADEKKYTVSEIGAMSFWNNAGDSNTYTWETRKIVLPDTIEEIGNFSFARLKNIEEVAISKGLKKIGDNAFNMCWSLTNINLPNSVTSIGECAFAGCRNLTNITLSSGLKSIGNDAFAGCDDFTNIILPSGLISIGDGTFGYCEKLTTITIPDTVIYMGENIFKVTSLKTINYEGSKAQWERISQNSGINSRITINYVNGELESNQYEEKVLTQDQKELQKLFTWNIQNEKAIITGLNKEYIKKTFTPKDNVEGSEEDLDYIYKNDKRLTKVIVPYEIEETDGKKYIVNEIGESAFATKNDYESYLYYIEKLILPNTIEKIGNYAFQGSIGAYPDRALSEFNIPDGIMYIAEGLFYGCKLLNNITIPSSVTSIGISAFSGCISLTTINYEGSKAQWESISKNSDFDSNVTINYVNGEDGQGGTSF